MAAVKLTAPSTNLESTKKHALPRSFSAVDEERVVQFIHIILAVHQGIVSLDLFGKPVRHSGTLHIKAVRQENTRQSDRYRKRSE